MALPENSAAAVRGMGRVHSKIRGNEPTAQPTVIHISLTIN
jgi:hypothetical protein